MTSDSQLRPVAEATPPEHAERASVARRFAPATLLRRHWLAAALLAAGLVLRVLALLAYRPALFYIDTSRYLTNSMGMDPLGYRAPLRLLLLIGNFDVVAAVQHLLGLAMAVVIYVLLVRRGVSRWLAALAMAPVLLDAYQIQQEQVVMPTAWFEALILAGLAILLWRPRPGWRAVLAAGVVLGASATFAQVGEALVVPAAFFVLVCTVICGSGWRQALGKAAALCAAFALPILAYSAGSYLLTGSFFLSHSGVTSFYGRMAAAADCKTLRLPAAEAGMCPSPAQQAKGSDWLEYNNSSPIRPFYNSLPRGQVDAMISDFDHRVLAQQRGRVVGAYGRDLLKLFEPGRVGATGDTPIYRWQFQTAYPYYPPWSSRQVVLSEIGQSGGGAPAVWVPAAQFLRSYQLGGGYTPGPLYALFAVSGLIGSLALLRRRLRPGTRQLALACLLFFGSAVWLLLISDLFEFSWRYQLPALVTLVPGGVLGMAVIIRLFTERREVQRITAKRRISRA